MSSERKAPVADAAAPPSTLTLALAQGNFRVGSLRANTERMAAYHRVATRIEADLVVFPELAVSGYPPLDLLFDRDFIAAHEQALEQCAQLTRQGCALLTGAVTREGETLHNSACLFAGGELLARQDKRDLPNRGVFDEKRYFQAGADLRIMDLRGVQLGVMLCEDAWTPDATRELAAAGAEILICLNASPFETDKQQQREWIAQMRTGESGLPLIYLNLVGAQDDLVFDGGSFVMNPDGKIAVRLAAFREDFQTIRLMRVKGIWSAVPNTLAEPVREDERAYQALVLALGEFASRNGYKGAVLGLSGGIDSALSAAIAVDAFGADRVEALFLPSPFTSRESRDDAFACAVRLGISCEELPIAAGMQAFTGMAGPMTEVVLQENQTRLRASLLLARARRGGNLLVNTGNKSEMATGYTTMYGDLCGDYAPLKDVYKTRVYRLAAWRNERGEAIPPQLFHKPPSAELAPGQRDDDVLPPYAILDAILEHLLEHELGADEIVARGHERTLVQDVQGMLDAAQHKRHQAPPGPKITRKALANERRYPISNGWYVERNGASKPTSS